METVQDNTWSIGHAIMSVDPDIISNLFVATLLVVATLLIVAITIGATLAIVTVVWVVFTRRFESRPYEDDLSFDEELKEREGQFLGPEEEEGEEEEFALQ